MGTNAAVPFDGVFNGQTATDGIYKHLVTGSTDYVNNVYPVGVYTYTITATTAGG